MAKFVDAPQSNQAVVAAPLGFTVTFNTAEVEVMLVAGTGGNPKAVAFAIATAIAIAAYSFFGALGVRASGAVLGFQAWLEILTGFGLLSFTVIRRRSAIGPFVRANYWTGLVAGILSVAGYLAYLAAAKVLPLAPSPSKLPWAVENLRLCNWCDQMAAKDLNDCPTCGRRMAPLAS